MAEGVSETLQHEVDCLYNRKPMMHTAVDGRTGCGEVWYSGGYRWSARASVILTYADVVFLPALSDCFEKSEVLF